MEKIVDNIGLLVVFLIIIANFALSMVQKAKAEEKRRRRLADKSQKAAEVPRTRPRPEPQRPSSGRPQGTLAQDRERTSRRQPTRPTQTQQKSFRPQDVIREWSKRLEEALQTPEGTVKPTPKPVSTQRPLTPQVPRTQTETPRTDRRATPPKRFTRRHEVRPAASVAFLAHLHPNPLVNGVILSEILGPPVSFRKDRPTLFQ